ncbi:isoprenylcysteine carboxylmethyltransferase family protein [Peptoniphilus sp. MSJ-1]|uniref:Isoprenylcysteine carboxylmethyltransferase family protein n=1 Tax=Peptoniphilus ovalis TaxID=2841503 RepID=A0ABS6FIM8_9FIRM|nr:isoprenylcysteine carboxylmethyltransferase family protein [Peptoniphilus ovalis]MBU5670025.1 isoprenylcysteine carboxylmethyltransferase family protein [Peptoniphilus ovalis]
MKNKMPVFGVGPIYVISIFILTLFGIYLDKSGKIVSGKIFAFNNLFKFIGILLIIFGIFLWIYAVIFQKINIRIGEDKLLTNGVYSIVRNPVYSAFTFILTGIIFFRCNLFLLIFPIVFYIYLSLLMINTEEKWLEDKFGYEYINYKNNVNRIIPWFRHKNSR